MVLREYLCLTCHKRCKLSSLDDTMKCPDCASDMVMTGWRDPAEEFATSADELQRISQIVQQELHNSDTLANLSQHIRDTMPPPLTIDYLAEMVKLRLLADGALKCRTCAYYSNPTVDDTGMCVLRGVTVGAGSSDKTDGCQHWTRG